jgi:hypothetical protein
MDDENNFNLILKKSFDYYDKNRFKYEYLFNKYFTRKYIHETIIINDLNYFIIKDKDNDDKIIFKSKYEWIGLITKDLKKNKIFWKWAWQLPWLTKKSLNIANELLKYAINLDIERDNKILKSLLLNTNVELFNNLNIDIYKAIISYYTKSSNVINREVEPCDENDLMNDPNFEYYSVLIFIDPEEIEN